MNQLLPEGNDPNVTESESEPGYRFEPKVEYIEVNSSIRHLSTLRVIQIAIFFMVMGGLAALLFGATQLSSGPGNYAANALACFVTLIFWLLEERAERQYDHLLRRAQSLERTLHFHAIRDRPHHRLLRTGVALRLLYFGTLIWWISAVSSTAAAH